MTYSRAIIFTKHTDLMPYFNANKERLGYDPRFPSHQRMKERYERKRDVSLILQIRYEVCSHMICRIKCPINPLPTKGEFKVSHLGAIIAFLEREGWTMQGNYSSAMFE